MDVENIVKNAIADVPRQVKSDISVAMESCVYEAKCTCGETLVVTGVEVDNDLDLFITVEPCPDCCKEEN